MIAVANHNRGARMIVAVAALTVGGLVGAAPIGYSVNSDAEVGADHLYEIDLATGASAAVGESGFADVEGLAFSGTGNLYGADDASDTLIRFDLATGVATPLGNTRGNLGFTGVQDYGLTFTCDGRLYMASEAEQQLYKINLDTVKPDLIGHMGVRITGLAAWGDDVYGIGSEGAEGIYRINVDSGQATLVQNLPGHSFNDAGLAFDAEGILWALLDQSFLPFQDEPSVILRIDLDQGTVTQTATTDEGFESLAITTGAGCQTQGPVTVTIPTLDRWGLLLMILLVLGVGARFSFRP